MISKLECCGTSRRHCPLSLVRLSLAGMLSQRLNLGHFQGSRSLLETFGKRRNRLGQSTRSTCDIPYPHILSLRGCHLAPKKNLKEVKTTTHKKKHPKTTPLKEVKIATTKNSQRLPKNPAPSCAAPLGAPIPRGARGGIPWRRGAVPRQVRQVAGHVRLQGGQLRQGHRHPRANASQQMAVVVENRVTPKWT